MHLRTINTHIIKNAYLKVVKTKPKSYNENKHSWKEEPTPLNLMQNLFSSFKESTLVMTLSKPPLPQKTEIVSNIFWSTYVVSFHLWDPGRLGGYLGTFVLQCQ